MNYREQLITLIRSEGFYFKFKALPDDILKKIIEFIYIARKEKKITKIRPIFRRIHSNNDNTLSYYLQVKYALMMQEQLTEKLFRTLHPENDKLNKFHLTAEASLDSDGIQSWISESKGIIYLLKDKARINLNEKIFRTLNPKNDKLNELYLTYEASLDSDEIQSWILESKGIVYPLSTKKESRVCYLCDEIRDIHEFEGYWMYGTRPYCLKCASLTSLELSKKRNKFEKKEREKRDKKLQILKKKRIAKDIEAKRKKEAKRREDMKLYKAEQALYRYEYFHEHGEYPQTSKSDNNIIYVWRHDNMYKIGVSSKRVGKKRIWHVANKGNMRAEVLFYEEVENSLALEKELLEYGTEVVFDRKFDGCTEFRHLTDEELDNIKEIIQQWKIIY